MKELDDDEGPLYDILVHLKDFRFDDDEEVRTPHQEFKAELERHVTEFKDSVRDVIRLERQIALVVAETTDLIEISKRLGDHPKIIEGIADYIENTNTNQLTEEYRETMRTVAEYRDLFKGLKSGLERFMCSVCLEATVDTFLDPCGHTVCSDCSDRINKKCPYCRTSVFKARRMIFS